MPIFDEDKLVPTEINDDVRTIRGNLARAIKVSDQSLEKIRDLVNKHGRTAVTDVLGAEAPDLIAIYGSIKTMLESPEVGITVPVLP